MSHYLTFAAEEISDGATRSSGANNQIASHRDELWNALIADEVVWWRRSLTGAAGVEADLRRQPHGCVGRHCLAPVGLAAVWNGAADRGVTVEHSCALAVRTPSRLAGSLRRALLPSAVTPTLSSGILTPGRQLTRRLSSTDIQ